MFSVFFCYVSCIHFDRLDLGDWEVHFTFALQNTEVAKDRQYKKKLTLIPVNVRHTFFSLIKIRAALFTEYNLLSIFSWIMFQMLKLGMTQHSEELQFAVMDGFLVNWTLSKNFNILFTFYSFLTEEASKINLKKKECSIMLKKHSLMSGKFLNLQISIHFYWEIP